MKKHVVKQGECLSAIAQAYGFGSWKKIWDDPQNRALRELRKSPNVLYEGDVLHVPDKELKTLPTATGKTHVFKKKRPKTRLKLKMRENDEPIADEPFRVEVGGRVIEGATDGDGLIDVEIPADVTEGSLVFTKRGESYTLMLGHLDPVTETTGVQARLRQLGYYVGAVDKDLGAFTRAAIEAFQKAQGLTPTGQMDDATRDALVQAHGC